MNVSENMVTIIFIVDTSGSMYGQKIEAVNAAVAECLEVLGKYQKKDGLMIGYVSFDETMGNIVLKKDLEAEIFKVSPNSDGFYKMTSFSGLYSGIYDIFRKQQTGDLCLFLITDGKPADSGEYTDALEKVKSLDAFRTADRYVALVNNDVNGMDHDVLEFVGFKADKILQLPDLSNTLSKVQALNFDHSDGSADDEKRYNSIFGD